MIDTSGLALGLLASNLVLFCSVGCACLQAKPESDGGNQKGKI